MLLPVNFAPIPEFQDQYSDALVLDSDDDPEIPNAVAPEAGWRSFQSFTETTRVFRDGDALAEKSEDSASVLFSKLAEATLGARG